MDQVNALLERTRFANIKDNDTAVVSFIGAPGFRTRPDYSRAKLSSTPVTVANRIIGTEVFVCAGERLPRHTTQFSKHLQLYVDTRIRTAYFYLDTSANVDQASDESDDEQLSFWKNKICIMLEFLFLFMVSQLVIPILPSGSPSKEFLSTLVALSQIKRTSYTQLMQLQTLVWKSLGIPPPPTETSTERRDSSKRDRDRSGPHWSGPIENVPVLIFVSADSPIFHIENLDRTAVSVALKQHQESLQHRLRVLLRASNLTTAHSDSRSSHDLMHGRLLFLLPTSSQPFVHIIPEQYQETVSKSTDIKGNLEFTFEEPISLSSWLEQDESNSSSSRPSGAQSKATDRHSVKSLIDECGDKLLRNFYSHWLRAVTSRSLTHFGPNRREAEARRSNIILPSALQLATTMTLLKAVLIDYQVAPAEARPVAEFVQTCATNAKGILHQVEAILRKKVCDRVQVERVFSKITCADIVRKCVEVYLQDSPAYYTRQYHLWKRASVMRLYQSLARGPCAAEYAQKLESDCENLWRQGRQSCEEISLTGKVCRLQAGHEEASGKTTGEKSAALQHNSGCTHYHACTCGRTQKLREDPFNVWEANIGFYKRFSCCLAEGHQALIIEKSTEGDQLVTSFAGNELPENSTILLYLGPASSYKNSVGLNKYEGFMNNTDYLVPWNLTAIVEEGKKQMEAAAAADAVKSNKEAERQTNDIDATQWPKLGSNVEAPQNEKKPSSSNISSLSVANLDAFPALGTAAKTKPAVPAPKPQLVYDIQNGKKEKRRRDGKRRDHHRLEGQIRGFLGAEYECPLGHRFISCGNGKICKLGHKDHPKEHAVYFVHQDLPLYLTCPCNFEGGRQKNAPVEITAQLQRLYIVTPDAPITISMEPRVRVKVPGTESVMETNLGFTSKLEFPHDGFYVLRLPYIYTDEAGRPIPIDPDPEKKLNAGAFMKDCFQVRFNDSHVAS